MVELFRTEATSYQIGGEYNLKLSGSYYKVTLIAIDSSQNPPIANVLIREHPVDSFEGDSMVRKRHKKRGEAVPIANVPLTDLRS